jgi:hypothetical protein
MSMRADQANSWSRRGEAANAERQVPPEILRNVERRASAVSPSSVTPCSDRHHRTERG